MGLEDEIARAVRLSSKVPGNIIALLFCLGLLGILLYDRKITRQKKNEDQQRGGLEGPAEGVR